MSLGLNPALDPIEAAPAWQGFAGRAWRIDLAAVRAALAIPPEDNAPVAGWIVEIPSAHPFWHSYWLSITHLRPGPGLPPPILHRPDATHELTLMAMDPTFAREPMLTRERVRFLRPANFVAQLVEVDDAAAIAVGEDTVAAMVAGSLNPDTDFIRQWIARFGAWCVRGAHRA